MKVDDAVFLSTKGGMFIGKLDFNNDKGVKLKSPRLLLIKGADIGISSLLGEPEELFIKQSEVVLCYVVLDKGLINSYIEATSGIKVVNNPLMQKMN